MRSGIRTPTVQTDHKALNLAHDLPDPSQCRRNDIRSARLDDLDWLDKTFVVTVLSRRRLPVLRFLSARAAAQLMLTW
jgi:hypothetical protein